MIDLDKSGGKPLRKSTNASKDISDTYGKAEENQIPINEQEEEMEKEEKSKIEEKKSEQNKQADEEIENLEKERDQYKEKYLRTVAELENLRRRTMKEKQEMLEYGNERLLFKMLELLDDINAANSAARKTEDFSSLLEGIELISKKAEKLFSEAGVKKMEDPVGSQFDVDYHEAMMTMAADEPEGIVVQQIQPGYMIGEKVLRHAKVVTSSGPEEN